MRFTVLVALIGGMLLTACGSVTEPRQPVVRRAIAVDSLRLRGDFDPNCLDCAPWDGVGPNAPPPPPPDPTWCASTGSYVIDPSQCPDL